MVTMRRGIACAIVSGALSFGSPVVAVQRDCNAAVSQRDINDCANRAFQKADDALNGAYRKRMAEEDARGKTLLTEAQRAWIIFRDKTCSYDTVDSEGGSIHPMDYAICLTEKTEARTKELQ